MAHKTQPRGTRVSAFKSPTSMLHAPRGTAPLNCAFATSNKIHPFGSERKADVGIGQIHGRTVYGDWCSLRNRSGTGDWSSLPCVRGCSEQPAGGRQKKA